MPHVGSGTLQTIKLVRHGQSMANTGQVQIAHVGDHNVGLTDLGRLQAREAGALIGSDYLKESLVFVSPYRRTRDTCLGILQGAGLTEEQCRRFRVYEDPRLRELEFGYAEDREAQREMRKTHGWFYYRFDGGESPADCYDRTSSFLDTMMRTIHRHKMSKVLIIAHGLSIRCFITRFMHLTTEQFETMLNPDNCAVVTISRTALVPPGVEVGFRSSSWSVYGDLRVRDPVRKPDAAPYGYCATHAH